jgi:hypothetical protein
MNTIDMLDFGKCTAIIGKPRIDLGYRTMMCEMIHQAICYSKGWGTSTELSGIAGKNRKRRCEILVREAREYLASQDFIDDCELLGVDVERVRKGIPIMKPPVGGGVISAQVIDRSLVNYEMEYI